VYRPFTNAAQRSRTRAAGGDTAQRRRKFRQRESNTTRAKECDDAMEQALAAAHNVEVGDYYFGKKNYDAALLRYDDAREEKPRDIAVHVRLGRVLERLKQLPRALEEYKAALKLSGPQKWSDEAKSALLRLEGRPS